MRYLLLAAAATALFFAAYWVLMRHEKRHQMVRWYLMATLVLSLLLPAIHLRFAAAAHRWQFAWHLQSGQPAWHGQHRQYG